MRRYEAILITDPDLAEDEIDVLVEKMKEFIANEKGEDIKIEQWGKRKLVYEIKKKYKGFYFLINYRGNSELASKFETKFRINEKVLRCQTVRVNKETPVEANDETPQDTGEEANLGEANLEAADGIEDAKQAI